MNAILLINENDNVLVCVKPLTAGEVLELEQMGRTAKNDILCYHKLALFAIRKGDLCYSFGQVIGRATRNIEEGAAVHNQDLIDDHQDLGPTRETMRKNQPLK